MRWSISLRESPRQYAPATRISLKVFSLWTGAVRPAAEVDPVALVERDRLLLRNAMISALYFSPMEEKYLTASSRDISRRSTGRSLRAISCIFFSIRDKSSE